MNKDIQKYIANCVLCRWEKAKVQQYPPQPDTLRLLPHTYCWEIWNDTGNSSTDNLPEHKNFSDLWINIKTWINQLIATQTSQHNTLVHIVSILNITRYATQVNRHSINTLMDAVQITLQDINNLYNLTTSLAMSINFNQMILHIRSVFANLWYSLHYIQTVSTHTMEYIDAAT